MENFIQNVKSRKGLRGVFKIFHTRFPNNLYHVTEHVCKKREGVRRRCGSSVSQYLIEVVLGSGIGEVFEGAGEIVGAVIQFRGVGGLGLEALGCG